MVFRQTTSPRSCIYHFDGYSFDAEKLELTKRGISVPLSLQPARLLKILLEQAPDFASRQLLQEKIWDTGTTVEFDRGINVCINQLRIALGDKANDPRFIATLPKRGYRFIFPIKTATRRTVSKQFKRLGFVVILVAALLAGSWALNQNGDPKPAKRVFVAPIEISQKDLSDFDGVAQYALRLGTVERLGYGDVDVVQTINGTSLWNNIDDSSFSTQFDYSMFLTLKRREAQFAVDAILISEKNNRIIEQKEFLLDTPNAANLSKTSGEVAIWAGKLLGVTDIVPSKLEQESNPAFFNAMVRARRNFLTTDPASLRQSLEGFKMALTISPESAVALEGQAVSLALLAGSEGFPASETYASALVIAEKIRVSHGPTPYSELAKSFIYLYRDWDLDRSRTAIERATKLTPGDAVIHSVRAGVLAAQGNIKMAADAAEFAVQLDPMSMAINSDRCWYLSAARQLTKAIDACEWVLEINPSHYTAKMTLASLYERMDRKQDAIEVLRASNSKPGSKMPQALQNRYCELSKQFEKRAKKATFPMTELAALQAKCGDFHAAAKSLNRGQLSGESGFLFHTFDLRFEKFLQQPVARTVDRQIRKRS